MKYALLIYGHEEGWAEVSNEEREKVYAQHMEFGQMLRARDAVRGGEELELTSAATTARRNGDDVMVTDGPFAETTEQLGGFYLVEAGQRSYAAGLARVRVARTGAQRCRHRGNGDPLAAPSHAVHGEPRGRIEPGP